MVLLNILFIMRTISCFEPLYTILSSDSPSSNVQSCPGLASKNWLKLHYVGITITNPVCKHITNSAYSASHSTPFPSNYLVAAEPCFGAISSPRSGLFKGLHLLALPTCFLLKTIRVRSLPAAANNFLHTNVMRPRFNSSIIHSRWEFGALRI